MTKIDWSDAHKHIAILDQKTPGDLIGWEVFVGKKPPRSRKGSSEGGGGGD